MSDGVMFILFCLTISALVIVVIVKQQNTIDRLTDKLMARDYSDYKRHDIAEGPPKQEDKEPLSYFDQ